MPIDSPLAKRVLGVMHQLIASGAERGLQVAAYYHGELLLDLAAGSADATARPVTTKTLFPVYSVTKGVAATIAHILAERGVVSYDRPIADVWPEFGCNGKEKITLRQALNHSAGLPLMPPGVEGPQRLGDWDFMCARIAELSPAWAPGSRIEYHPVTFGWIVGETLCRAAGRSFQQLLEEEILEPLVISDLYVGLPPGVEAEIAVVEEDRAIFPQATRPPTDEPEAIPWWLFPLDELMNRREAQSACLPATSGLMTAHAIARHYAGVLPDGVDNINLITPIRMSLAKEPQFPRPVPPDFEPWIGLGYQIGFTSLGAFGHGGHGGSTGFADPALGLAVGIAKTRLNRGPTAQIIADTIRSGLG